MSVLALLGYRVLNAGMLLLAAWDFALQLLANWAAEALPDDITDGGEG